MYPSDFWLPHWQGMPWTFRPQFLPYSLSSLYPFFSFSIKKSRYADACFEKDKKNIVKKYSQNIDFKPVPAREAKVKSNGETTCILLFLRGLKKKSQ